jgi:hypothetical protein
VKAVKAVAMLNHEHSEHSHRPCCGAERRLIRLTPARSVSDLVRGSWLPPDGAGWLHGRSCFVRAVYQDWPFAPCRACEPGSWRSCPRHSFARLIYQENQKRTRRCREDATQMLAPSSRCGMYGARPYQRTMCFNRKPCEPASVGVAGSLKLEPRHWQYNKRSP